MELCTKMCAAQKEIKELHIPFRKGIHSAMLTFWENRTRTNHTTSTEETHTAGKKPMAPEAEPVT